MHCPEQPDSEWSPSAAATQAKSGHLPAHLNLGVGLGSGGVFVALSRRLRELPPERLLTWLALLGGAAIGGGYFAIAAVEVSTHEPPSTPSERSAAVYL